MPDGDQSERNGDSRSLGPFRPHSEGESVLAQLGAAGTLADLRSAHNALAAVHSRVSSSNRFTFLDKSDFDRLKAQGEQLEAEYLWRQVHQLLILVARSSSFGACGLIDAITWSIGTTNELALALTLRALIEHASAADFIRTQLAGQQERLHRHVWPALASRARFPALTLRDRCIHAELIRFAVGRQTDHLNDFPDPHADVETWRKFYEGQFAAAEAISPAYRPRRVTDFLNPLRSMPGLKHLPAVYARLCEYCHPNSASRSADLQPRQTETRKHEVGTANDGRFTLAFLELIQIARLTVPASCNMLVSAVNEMANCWMPLPAVEPAEGAIPPPGTIEAVDQHGRTFFAPLDKVETKPDPARMLPLTPAQEERVRRVHRELDGADRQPVEQALDGFRMDGVHAEEEIRLYEHMLRVYKREVGERGTTSLQARRAVYAAILLSTFFSQVSDLVSAHPELKSFGNLNRLFVRVKER